MSSTLSTPSNRTNQVKTIAIVATVFIVVCLLLSTPALAGTGNSSQVGARVSSVASGFLSILQLAGVAILTGAFMYVGYGMAWMGKKWTDVANVAYGCLIGGLGSLLVGWLFS